MYLIVDRKTKEILYMCNWFPDEQKKPKSFHPSTRPQWSSGARRSSSCR